MGNRNFDLALTLKAVDKFTAPLRAMTVEVHRLTKPLRNFKLFDQAKDLGKALNAGGVLDGLRGVGSALGNVGDAMLGFIMKIGALGVAGIAAFYGLMRVTETAGSALNDHSKRVGMTADFYASLGFAMKRGGVDAEQYTTALDKLNKNLGEMKVGKGGGALLELLRKTGPGLAEQMKGAKSSEEAMALLTDAFHRIDDPSRRAVLALAAFGKGGVQMGEALHVGSAEIQQMQAEFLRLSGSQARFAANADALGDAFDNAETALMGLRNAVAGELMPAFTKLVKAFTEFVVKNRDSFVRWAERAGAAISAWVDSGGMERLFSLLQRVGSAIASVVEFLGPMGTALAVVGVLALPIVAALGSLVAAVFSLGVALIPAVTALAGMGIGLGAIASVVGTVLVVVGAFVAMVASLAYLGKVLHDNWDEIAWQFRDIGNSLRWAFIDTWKEVQPILEKLSNFFGMRSGSGLALKAALSVGDAVSRKLTPEAAQAAAPASLQSEARISVDMSNLPPGTRVSVDPSSSQSVDLSMGYSMVQP